MSTREAPNTITFESRTCAPPPALDGGGADATRGCRSRRSAALQRPRGGCLRSLAPPHFISRLADGNGRTRQADGRAVRLQRRRGTGADASDECADECAAQGRGSGAGRAGRPATVGSAAQCGFSTLGARGGVTRTTRAARSSLVGMYGRCGPSRL